MYDLETLSARAEVEEHLYRYPLLVDSGRYSEIAQEIFTEDATLGFGEMKCHGHDEIHNLFLNATLTIAHTSHNITNLMMKIDGDKAKAFYRILGWHWMKASQGDPLAEQDMLTIGGYEDELIRTAKGWRVSKRQSFACGTGIGIARPVPTELRDFMETIAGTQMTWR